MVKLFLDTLHGIVTNNVSLVVALEFTIFLGFDGQLKQNSDLERELFKSIVDQLKRSKMTKVENALIWLYAKSWNQSSADALRVSLRLQAGMITCFAK